MPPTRRKIVHSAGLGLHESLSGPVLSDPLCSLCTHFENGFTLLYLAVEHNESTGVAAVLRDAGDPGTKADWIDVMTEGQSAPGTPTSTVAAHSPAQGTTAQGGMEQAL